MNLDLTDLVNGYTLDDYTIEDIREFALDCIKQYKNLRAELVYRLETGNPFSDVPVGVYNPEAYEFLHSKLNELKTMFEDSELELKSSLDRFKSILDKGLPWSDKDVVDRRESADRLEFLDSNIKLTKKRLKILEILRKYYLG